jgi:hypothetical protein
VRSDFPDAFFADELEAALSELEASLDFPPDVDATPANDSSALLHNRTESDFNLSNLSDIESTLNELANTTATSTPSKSDLDTTYASPYSTPTHSALESSRSSPYADYPSSSIRANTPLASQLKPPAPPRVSSDPKPTPSATAKPIPKSTTPPPGATLKKTTSPKLTPLKAASPSPNPPSFISSFESPSNTASTSAGVATPTVPDSPKIRSRLSRSFVPQDIVEDQQQVPTPSQDDEGFSLSSSFPFD